jgi:hypothetical protein
MSILDDAIREHLELKRAHGADETELKRLESEAFGPAELAEEANPFAEEAPTEFLGAAEEAPSGRREPNIADLQEPPPPPPPVEEEPAPEAEAEAPAAEPEAETPEPEAEEAPLPPAEESHPATELRAIPETEAPPAPEPEPAAESPNTEERHAIAEQPTQFFDIEAEIAEEEGDDSAPEAQAAPEVEVEPAAPAAAEEPFDDEEEDDDFFSEQRLSDELDQALEAPLPGEEPPRSRAEEPIPPGPHTEEAEAHYAERESEEHEYEDEDDEDDDEVFEPEDASHDDVLEDTPDFLEDAPDADDAWFEQRPPKDFDFDD